MSDATLGEEVRALRIRLGWTQEELAEAAGTSPQYVSEIERSLKQPSDEKHGAIAMALATGLATTNESGPGLAPSIAFAAQPHQAMSSDLLASYVATAVANTSRKLDDPQIQRAAQRAIETLSVGRHWSQTYTNLRTGVEHQDRVELEQIGLEQLRGVITREKPAKYAGRTWAVEAIHRCGFLFGIFTTQTADDPLWYGTIQLMQTRLDEGAPSGWSGFMVRPYVRAGEASFDQYNVFWNAVGADTLKELAPA